MSCPPSPTLSTSSADFVHVPDPTPSKAKGTLPPDLQSLILDLVKSTVKTEVSAAVSRNSTLYPDLSSNLRVYIGEELDKELDEELYTSSETSSETSSDSTNEDYADLAERVDRLDADISTETDVRAELGVKFSDFQSRFTAQLRDTLTFDQFQELKIEVLREVRVNLAAGRESQRMSLRRTRDELAAQLSAQLNTQLNTQLDTQLDAQLAQQLSELESYKASLRAELGAFKSELRAEVLVNLEDRVKAVEKVANNASRRVGKMRRTQWRLSAVAETMVAGTEMEGRMREAWKSNYEKGSEHGEEGWKWLDEKEEIEAAEQGTESGVNNTEEMEKTNEDKGAEEEKEAEEASTAASPSSSPTSAPRSIQTKLAEVNAAIQMPKSTDSMKTPSRARCAPWSQILSQPTTQPTLQFGTASTLAAPSSTAADSSTVAGASSSTSAEVNGSRMAYNPLTNWHELPAPSLPTLPAQHFCSWADCGECASSVPAAPAAPPPSVPGVPGVPGVPFHGIPAPMPLRAWAQASVQAYAPASAYVLAQASAASTTASAVRAASAGPIVDVADSEGVAVPVVSVEMKPKDTGNERVKRKAEEPLAGVAM